MFKRTFAALALTLATTATTVQAQDLWFHVTVREQTENANVTINLPLALVEKALTMIPAEVTESGNVVLDDQEFNAAELRAMWQSIQGAKDMEFVTIDTNDENLRVAKNRGYLTVKGTAKNEKGSNIDVRLPLTVVDALLDTPEDNQLNVAGALRALAEHGEGELATVTDDNAHVRVWIDQFPEAR